MDTTTHFEFDDILQRFTKNFGNQMHYYYYKRLFSDDECDKIIKDFRELCRDRATVFGSNGAGRITDVTWIPKNTTTDWIYDRVLKSMVEANDNMFHFELTTLKDKIQLGCYRGDQKGKYGRHVDMGSDDIHACRKLSISILLSEPDAYEGGDLILRTITAPRERGNACVFASFTEHEVTPVTSGERYSLVLWVYGPPFR
jgi:PKHD-type hydroxylase